MAKMIGRDHTGADEWHFDERDFDEAYEDIALLRKFHDDVRKIDRSLIDISYSFDRCAPNCLEFEDQWSDFDEALYAARSALTKAIDEMANAIERARVEPLEEAKDRIAEEWMTGERVVVRGE